MATTDMLKELSESYVRAWTMPEGPTFNTIPDCLKHHAATRPDKEAFVFVGGDGSREAVTWAKLYDRSVRAARGFIQLGIKRHDLVAINVRNCSDWLYINFGIILAGAYVAHSSFAYKDGSDIVQLMEKLGTCSTIVLDTGVDDNWNICKKLMDEHSIDGAVKSEKMPNLKYMIVLNRHENMPGLNTFQNILTDAPSSVELPCLDADDVISLFETSDSTGEPKLIARTHTSLLAFCIAATTVLETCAADADMYNKQNSGKDVLDPSNHVFYNYRPFSWIGGWPFNVQNGIKLVTPSGLHNDPDDGVALMIDVVIRENCDTLGASPKILHTMIERKGELGPEWPVKGVLIGGQPATKEFAKCVGSICKRMISVYAGPDIGIACMMIVDDIKDFEEYSCGRPLPGSEIKIVDESGKTVPVGVTGEVYLRSNQLFQHFWKDMQKTKEVLTADGWFKTDDIGHLSKKGVLYVGGRKSEMILSGEGVVSPAVLERAIKTCPDVAAVIVVPIPHPSLFQVVCACVIPVAGSDLTEEALRRYCESIHNNQYAFLPKYHLIFEKFPQTSSGEVSRKELAIIAEKMLKKL